MQPANHQLTQSEFDEWLVHPVTRALMAGAKSAVEEAKHEWSMGVFTVADSAQETAHRNARALGQIQQLMDLINLTLGDIQ